MNHLFSPVILALGSMLATIDLVAASVAVADDASSPRATLTGNDALGDWTTDAPVVRRKVTLADLATPYETPSANNFPRVVRRPQGAWPKAPEGFKVTEFATRLVRTPRDRPSRQMATFFFPRAVPIAFTCCVMRMETASPR